MTQNNTPTHPPEPETHPLPPPSQPDDEINLIDLIYPIYKRRKFLILFCIIITLAVAVKTYFTPKTYEATAVILPELRENGGSGLELKAAFLEQFGIAGIGGGESTPSEIFGAVLKSRQLAWDVLTRYDYFSIMGVNKGNRLRTAQSFIGLLRAEKSQDNPTLSVDIQSRNPRMAADIANSYINALDRYNRENSFTSNRRLREYIERRLEAANKELDEAQENLREFQEKNRAVSIGKQTEATLQVLSEMEAQRVVLEVQKAARGKFYKEPHREIEQLEAQMEALQKNIDRLTYSDKSSVPVEREKGRVEFYIPLTRIPALNFNESKLLLKVKAKTGVVTMLTTQLEQAKLDEAKDMPTINVLEWADPPKSPAKPKLKLNIVLGFVISLFLGIFLIFLLEFTQRMDHDPESSPKWGEMKKSFKSLIPFVK